MWRRNQITGIGWRAPLVVALVILGMVAGAVSSHALSDRAGSRQDAVSAATVVTVDAVADVVIMQGYADTNLGDTTDIWIGYDDYLTPDGEITRGLIRFDLPTIPAGNEIISATLRLYHEESWDFVNTFDTITAYGVGQSWEELSVTWNNAPSTGKAYSSMEVPDDPVHQWYELDVTELVGDWVSGSSPNHGVYLFGGGGVWCEFILAVLRQPRGRGQSAIVRAGAGDRLWLAGDAHAHADGHQYLHGNADSHELAVANGHQHVDVNRDIYTVGHAQSHCHFY